MPDLLSVLTARWKLIITLTLMATVIAFLATLVTPKKYLGTVTALPASPVVGDKARIFNQNIEALYNELGSPDELDRIEGTAKLDTIFLAAANTFNLATHYGIERTDELTLQQAAATLKENTNISRTGYGELKIKVWDRDKQMAASLANALLASLNEIHRHLQTQNNRLVLQRLKEDYAAKQQVLQNIQHKVSSFNPVADTIRKASTDSLSQPGRSFENSGLAVNDLSQQLTLYTKLISEYELALKTTPNVLLVVEPARVAARPDKPDTKQTLVLAFLSSFLFSFLLAVYLESRSKRV